MVKAAINTHLQLTQGELPIYGRVLYFELHDESANYRAFGLDGEFMSVFK